LRAWGFGPALFCLGEFRQSLRHQFLRATSFLIGRDGSSRLILKRRRVALGRGQAASKLVWRRTVAGPKLGPPNGPDELAIGRLFRLGLDRGVPAGGRRRLCEAGADKCKHQKYCRNCAFHSSYLIPDPTQPAVESIPLAAQLSQRLAAVTREIIRQCCSRACSQEAASLPWLTTGGSAHW